MKGRLNVFQAGMVRWRALHPYNAVHVVHVRAPLDVARLQAVLDTLLAALGLTGLVLDAARGRYEYRGGPVHAELRVLPHEGSPAGTIDAEIERQLNQPFARDGRIDPFRFFAIVHEGGFHLGLAYDHFVAGGDSIVALLQAITGRYTGAVPGDAPTVPPPLYPVTCRGIVARHPVRVVRGLRHVRETIARGRRAFRPRYPHGDQLTTGFVRLTLEAADLAALKGAAKAWEVTRNDLLIAILLQALAPFTEERRAAPRRREIAIASIVNIRSEFGTEAGRAFGQFLSSYLVSHPVPAGADLAGLARDVHAQTATLRRERRYFQTLLGIAATGLVWRLLSPERRLRFHAKSYPVWAGCTPLDVDALWRPGAGPVPEYVRGVPTGPFTPIAMAVTTAGEGLQIGLTYRTAAFERENVVRIAAAIRQSIRQLS